MSAAVAGPTSPPATFRPTASYTNTRDVTASWRTKEFGRVSFGPPGRWHWRRRGTTQRLEEATRLGLPPVGRVVEEVLGLARVHRHYLDDLSGPDVPGPRVVVA